MTKRREREKKYESLLLEFVSDWHLIKISIIRFSHFTHLESSLFSNVAQILRLMAARNERVDEEVLMYSDDEYVPPG